MGLGEAPETKMARRIIAKHSLKVPFNLEKLVKQYAHLIHKYIPIPGVDGVSLNLKVPGKKPTIILNSHLPITRQVFTLAHELGHIIIPWHLGTIVDEIYNQSLKDLLYSIHEQEANRFAAELLMPRGWVLSEFVNSKDDLASMHKNVVTVVGVSALAAAIRLIEILPPNIIYVAEEYGRVLYSGTTLHTNARLPSDDATFCEKTYPYVERYTTWKVSAVSYHWWKLSSMIEIRVDDDRSWREILDAIAEDVRPKEGVIQFKKSINGIMANANGKVKRQEDYSINTVISACIYRLKKPELEAFTSHPDFEAFVKIRVQDFFKP